MEKVSVHTVIRRYIVGCQGASQLGGSLLGIPRGYICMKLAKIAFQLLMKIWDSVYIYRQPDQNSDPNSIISLSLSFALHLCVCALDLYYYSMILIRCYYLVSNMFEKHFSTSVWSPEHPKAGQNIQKYFQLIKNLCNNCRIDLLFFFQDELPSLLVDGLSKNSIHFHNKCKGHPSTHLAILLFFPCGASGAT